MRIGADEAGKGPALGPMTTAAVRADPDDLPPGLADSKQLPASRRRELDAALRAHPAITVAVVTVSPERIDTPETDMNSIGVAAQAQAISQLVEDGDEVIADAADTDAERFGRRLADAIDVKTESVEVLAEHGADENHPVVSAASIVAKVERDKRMAAIDDSYDHEVGSGYPSDPATKAFLECYVSENGELPPCARESWSTCEDVLAAASQSGLDEF
ncbi:MAG: ribonuclease HII [Halolamina sp.]|uniref:ribonuclease HII n=1 Tax=Halolamina sp. TaxID=1940283 RepID=UPI002FC278E4